MKYCAICDSRLSGFEDETCLECTETLYPTTPIEWDYMVVFYNRFACQTQTFRVTAINKFRAGREFYRKHNRKMYKDCIEVIEEIY